MTEWYPYRFKTEKEFIFEYGSNWRYIVNFNYQGNMDYLCGKSLPFGEDVMKTIIGMGNLRYDGWSIGHKMITKNRKPMPDYSPRKIIKSIDEDYE